jgi:formylglycine-generating enzyme required for sulfatase activity
MARLFPHSIGISMFSERRFLWCQRVASAVAILLIGISAVAQQPPYDVFPPADPPYYRVRYEASKEPGDLIFPVNYTIWIPPGVKQLRGVIVHQHGCGEGSCKSGLTGAYDLHWQALAKKHDCALLAPAYEQPEKADCQMWCDPRNGSGNAFEKCLADLGAKSGHPELAKVPWALWGHSGGGHWAGGMVLLHPDRVAAAWLRSGVPLLKADPARPGIKAHTPPDDALRVPLMCNLGTKEGVTVKDGRFARVWPANEAFFGEVRSKGGLIGVAVDPLSSHDCGNQRYLAIPWLDTCLSARLPKSSGDPLQEMPNENAYLAEPTGAEAVAVAKFNGDARKAAWLPNESIAQAWMQYVKDTAVGDKTPPPAPTNVRISGNELQWEAEADLESGLASFIIERDGKPLTTLPEKSNNPFGRPIFQNLQYSDTPTQPLVPLRFTDSTARPGDKHTYRIIAVNTLGLKSQPSADVAAKDDHVPTTKEITNSVGMRMMRIEVGEFTMGTEQSPPKDRQEWEQRDSDESPVHKVKITAQYYLGANEVTNRQFELFDPHHKKFRGIRGSSKQDDDPVAHVTWQQATEYCAWLSEKEGLLYRLPTEAEWEYACRAGTTTRFHTGDELTVEQANLGKNKDGKSLTTSPVGSYAPNAWGLYDMHGNVAEWCLDWYGAYETGDQQDPVGRADGFARVVRGWSWQSAGFQKADRFARSANRSGRLPEDADCYTGFRVALGAMPQTKPLPVAQPPLHQQNLKQTRAAKGGPDPDEPYFVDFTAGKKNPSIPPNSWGPIFSQHNHFSACCVCPNGDVLAAWYTCVGEGDRQLAQAASRFRADSDTWEPATFFFGVPDVNTHAPVLLRDGQRIYHFCTQSLHGWDYASNIVRWSDDNGATWTKPRIMLPRTAPDRLSQPCSAFVAADGALILACDGDGHRDERLIWSDDKGQTWTVAKGDIRATVGKYAIHPAIVPRADGAILAFLRGPDPMPMLISKDRGDSWEMSDSPFPGISVGQKASALRLESGALLLLTNDKAKRLGGNPILALSLDDGKTWPHVRKVEAPVGGYMSMAQADNGVIYLVGSQLKCAACNEAWIKKGNAWLAKVPQ